MNDANTCLHDTSSQQGESSAQTRLLAPAVKTTRNKPVKYSIYASPVGLLSIRHNGHSIQQISYLNPQESQASCVQYSSLPQRWQKYLNHYFFGDFSALNRLPIRLDQGTEFQQQVWLALRKIKAGQTWSYSELANRIKRPNAVRAVGQALNRNPVAIVLPCHRIIQQSGALGSYAGDTDTGTYRKQFLLWHEGAIIPVAKHKTSTDVL